jgi:hypothetical protein
MNFGIDLSFLIPIDFWGYMSYAVFLGVLTAIPAILSFRYDNETSVILILLFVVGLAEMIYSLHKTWDAMPNILKIEIVVAVGIVFLLLTGGAAGAGSYRHQSE